MDSSTLRYRNAERSKWNDIMHERTSRVCITLPQVQTATVTWTHISQHVRLTNNAERRHLSQGWSNRWTVSDMAPLCRSTYISVEQLLNSLIIKLKPYKCRSFAGQDSRTPPTPPRHQRVIALSKRWSSDLVTSCTCACRFIHAVLLVFKATVTCNQWNKKWWHICRIRWQIHNGTYWTLNLALTIALTLLTLIVTVSGNPNPTNPTTKYHCEFDNLFCIYAEVV